MAASTPSVTSDAHESPNPARSKSRLLSIVATGGLFVAVGSCCLCGGIVYMQWPAFDEDPEGAAQMTAEILPISIPEVFLPKGTIRWDVWMFLSMRGAYFTLSNGDGELSFLEVDGEFINNDEFRRHIKKSLREHGAGGGYDLAVKPKQTRTYDVAGTPVDFDFLEAENRTTGTEIRLVDGIVEGNNGPVMISFWVDEENWDPQLVDDLINSIGAP